MKNLIPLTELAETIRRKAADYIKREAQRTLDNAEETIKKIGEVRLAMQLLAAEGIDSHLPSWGDGDVLYVKLGERPRTKRALKVWVGKLAAIRRALGRFGKPAKDLENAKRRLIEVTLTPVDFQHVYVKYLDHLPRTTTGSPPKCRIVSRRQTNYSSRLVCEL